MKPLFEMRSILKFLILVQVVFIIQTNIANCGGPVNNEELYKLLGVAKTATTKQIRVAFKKLALEKHPDKNQEDPNANEIFIKINRAYEILKDEDLRKKYDLYGEDGLKDSHNNGQNYQSWNFYQQNFGIYDDDPEIITLSRSDFMQSVDSNTDTIWFVNFYSTQCSHCHDLAPTWRELAKQLVGVVKIGAVNCMDDWLLCNQQQIQSFPSLIMYPTRERFLEHKSLENLLKFTLSFAKGKVHNIKTLKEYDSELKKDTKPWLISYCLSNDDTNINDENELNYELNCLEDSIQYKLAIMLNGLVNVGSINCNTIDSKELCSHLKPKKSSPLVYYNNLPTIDSEAKESKELENFREILTTDHKKISEQVLSFLPEIKELSFDEFSKILENLRDINNKQERPWLIQFYNPDASQNDLENKRLPNLLQNDYNFAKLNCQLLENTPLDCRQRFQIVNFPTFVLFKSLALINNGQIIVADTNWYEIYYSNRQSPQDLSKFVKDNAFTPVRTLTDFDLTTSVDELIANNKLGYFVDFFAPWCPPCLGLLPEFRKASKLEGSKSILFGTIDCTVNVALCEKFNVKSYPTTILFNNTIPHNYHGHHSAEDISDFIQDILKPSVITLNYESFYELVGSKPIGQIWLVDFYASWCGPCQQLAPEWRKLAKKIDSNVGFVGQVDCVVEQRLCSEQGINSYPNIRVFVAEASGYSQFEQYQGWMRDANSLFQWASNYLPSKAVKLGINNFEQTVLKNFNNGDEQPWLVDFYAPWCGHCVQFAPVFESLAAKLEGKVKLGKVNCQFEQYLCQLTGIRAFPTIRFYPMADSYSLNWDSGEDILYYDFDSILNVVNSKVKSYGYKNKKTEL